ncbi:MAG: thrS [Bacteriovoracaceae bacterium]|nr:thrS [Bacteriovoracaceae bacterium]
MEQFRKPSDPDFLHALRHSGAHLMAQAVKRLFPEAKLTVGPVIEEPISGFFYDMDLNGKTLSPDDLPKIEEEMKKIVKENLKVIYSEMPRDEAKAFLKKTNQPYKVELVDSFPSNEPISFYQQGEFIDLCEGPHIRFTGELKHFKLLNISGAYWKGDQNGPMLQRIYGTVFKTKDELDAYLKMLEEAKKRDHRELGKTLDLFSFHEYAPGIPFFHPKGTTVFNLLIEFIREIYRDHGYQEVLTPLIFDSKLYHQSGHFEGFDEFMFKIPGEEGQLTCLKPMNCPGHCLYYKGQLFSYRDLPLRVAEFSKLHRNEKSGALHGITRVRAMSQDDAHIFCAESQIESETEKFFEFVDYVYKTFGFNSYEVKLALRPDKKVGSEELWNKAEKIMEDLLKKRNIPYKLSPGEGAFYGPKYEFHVRDAIGRPWQLATLQLDFALPERFGLEYVGEDTKRHRPVMLHRAVLGSLERFYGVYLEHCEGYFPTWLAPVQIYLVPVRENHNEFARATEKLLHEKGIRVVCDTSEGNMGGKVRKATVARVPYIAVIGDKEIEAKSLALKSPKHGDFGVRSINEFVETILKEIKTRSQTPLLNK